MRRSPAQITLTILFAFLALNAWVQVALVAMGRGDDPALLVALQALVGAAGAAAAWGTWTVARWAPAAAAAYAVVTAAMLLALGPILSLEAEARPGLWTGAAGVLGFGLWSAWWLRRLERRSRQGETVEGAGCSEPGSDI